MKDSEFLEWAGRKAWEPWQGSPLSVGEQPSQEMTDAELELEYPAATWVLKSYRANLELVPSNDEEWTRRAIPESPEEWIYHACGNAPLSDTVPREWTAIFPYSVGHVPEFGKEHEPDYRDFIDAYSRDHRRSLEDLGRFSLSLPENPKFEGKFKRLLLAVNDALSVDQRAKTEQEIPSVMVSTRWFFDNYPSGHRMADLCEDWVYWFKNHPVLLRVLDEADSDGRKDTRETDWAFYLQNGLWHIGPLNTTETLRDIVGFQYLNHLLARPREPVSATELYLHSVRPPPEIVSKATVDGGVGWAGEPEQIFDRREGETIRIGGTGQDATVTRQIRREVTRAIEGLQEEKEVVEANNDLPLEEREERLAELSRDIEQAAEYLSSASGLGGASRDLTSSAAQRHRSNVTNAITRAYSKLEPHQPDIADHLRQSIRTGGEVVYQPPHPYPRWILTPPKT